ncbi:MAG: hypothetical protein J3R72DRAFT_425036 [Linnemannia gamsii]|nr:MAG: hypothetical protein J3R72DRAFT_425036 [Linnemannia gamsii]
MRHCPRYHHPTPFSVKDVGNGYIWACRGLKTLHLSIGPAFGNNSSPDTMLIVFGFLSRMCPLLEELYLSGRDLFWIRQTPTIHSTWDRHLTCGIQRLWLLKRRAVEFGALNPSAVAIRLQVIKLGQELGMDLSKIGHPDDLLECMDELYGRSSKAISGDDDDKQEEYISLEWPKLESFWLGCHTLHKSFRETEKFMAKVQPNVDFEMARKRLRPMHMDPSQFL